MEETDSAGKVYNIFTEGECIFFVSKQSHSQADETSTTTTTNQINIKRQN